MSITSHQTLTDAQHRQLKHLVSECERHDGNSPKMHWSLINKRSTQASLYTFEQNNQLQGFLKVFFFYEKAVEIILLVHPDFRQQGIAKQLLEHSKPLLIKENIRELRFSFAEQQCAWLEKKGAGFDESDHKLMHSLKTLKPARHTISHATLKQSQNLIELDVLCFDHRSLTQARIEQLLANKAYDIWVINKKNKAIAKLHMQHHNETVEVFDVAVHPGHQRQGYATSLLCHALLDAKQKNKVSVNLSVVTKNQNALSLYVTNGFDCVNTHHYWKFFLK
tara:strand:- start:597 stop:1433 length:837 start_codon:yes stop_codon:yes gene_type:complete